MVKTDFDSRNCTFTEKKLLVGSFGEAGYKGKNIIRFNVLDGLL